MGAGLVIAAALLLFGGFALGHWAFPPEGHGGHHRNFVRMERRDMQGGPFGWSPFPRDRGNAQPAPPNRRDQNNQRPQGNNQAPRGNGSAPSQMQDFLDWLRQSGVITRDQEQGIQNFFNGLQR